MLEAEIGKISTHKVERAVMLVNRVIGRVVCVILLARLIAAAVVTIAISELDIIVYRGLLNDVHKIEAWLIDRGNLAKLGLWLLFELRQNSLKVVLVIEVKLEIKLLVGSHRHSVHWLLDSSAIGAKIDAVVAVLAADLEG